MQFHLWGQGEGGGGGEERAEGGETAHAHNEDNVDANTNHLFTTLGAKDNWALSSFHVQLDSLYSSV